jgi:hypothetical protein
MATSAPLRVARAYLGWTMQRTAEEPASRDVRSFGSKIRDTPVSLHDRVWYACNQPTRDKDFFLRQGVGWSLHQASPQQERPKPADEPTTCCATSSTNACAKTRRRATFAAYG